MIVYTTQWRWLTRSGIATTLTTFGPVMINQILLKVNSTPCLHYSNGPCISRVHKLAICTAQDVQAAYDSYTESAQAAVARTTQAALDKATAITEALEYQRIARRR